jgi:AcrR family transcriptional regulator
VQDLRTTNKLRRRHQILQAAHDLITRKGVEALSMRMLADAAQVSVPTIYALVGGRDDVITALLAEGVHRYDEGLAGLDSRGLYRVTDLIELLTGILDHERELVRGLLASGVLASIGSDRFLILHRMRQELTRAFGEAVGDGELAAGTDPAAAATVMVRLGLGAIVDWVVQRGDPEDLRADLLRSVSVVIAAFS